MPVIDRALCQKGRGMQSVLGYVSLVRFGHEGSEAVMAWRRLKKPSLGMTCSHTQVLHKSRDAPSRAISLFVMHAFFALAALSFFAPVVLGQHNITVNDTDPSIQVSAQAPTR
jgi:hypothetical protein